jgi:UDPglucose--hexose-1-phosphate uridylyltransferase
MPNRLRPNSCGAAMYKRTLRKTDGRALILYARDEIDGEISAPSPPRDIEPANPHLRWHPLREEWVAYAGHRQNRTFLPPADFNPLAPTSDPSNPTELPAGNYDVAVFDNRFPTFAMSAHDPPMAIVETRPARGACEVVVFTQDPHASLGTLPLAHVELVVDVWADRYLELGARSDIQYVMPFENRGVEVGVTLHHPHGQIYAYPFVPPEAARELKAQREYLRQHSRGLLEDLIDAEIRDGRRLLCDSSDVVAFVPVCARYPYEVWIAPRRPAPSLAALEREERREFSRVLKTVLLKYDALWSRPLPYVMIVHQAPTDGAAHPEAHVHVEFYPPYRMPDRLKYLAGSELGAGVFTADTLPEAKAAELRAINVAVA